MIRIQIGWQIYQMQLQNHRRKLTRRAHLHRRSLRNAPKQVVSLADNAALSAEKRSPYAIIVSNQKENARAIFSVLSSKTPSAYSEPITLITLSMPRCSQRPQEPRFQLDTIIMSSLS
jgi:hypothetical protein